MRQWIQKERAYEKDVNMRFNVPKWVDASDKLSVVNNLRTVNGEEEQEDLPDHFSPFILHCPLVPQSLLVPSKE